MHRMSSQDAAFLHIEDDTTSMHIGSVVVLEGPAPAYDGICRFVEAKLPQVPRYRQKVRFVPMEMGRPVWVDDAHFHLPYHVRHTALPPPGGEEELRNLVGQLMSQQLDRTRPLWEMWFVEGLEDNHWAIVSKLHHCMVDGISATDILTVLLDDRPEGTMPPRAVWLPQDEPSDAQLLFDAVVERWTSPYEQVRAIRSLLRAPRQLGERQRALDRLLGQLGQLPRGAQQRTNGAHLLVRAGPAFHHGVEQQLGVARLVLGQPDRPRRYGALGAVVEQHGQEVGCRDAVDHAVVQLGHDRPVVVLQTLDEPHLPQRPGAVQLLGHQLTNQVAQLLLAAGWRQRGVPDVVRKVEVGVVDPHRPTHLHRDEAHLLPVARHLRQLGLDEAADPVVRRGRTLQYDDRADVHGRGVVLDMQERGVLRAHSVHQPLLAGSSPHLGNLPGADRQPASGRCSGGSSGTSPASATSGVSACSWARTSGKVGRWTGSGARQDSTSAMNSTGSPRRSRRGEAAGRVSCR